MTMIVGATGTTNQPARTDEPSVELFKTQIEVQKREIDVLRDFQSRIFQTISYSLGTVGAVALLLVGYNWWSANRVYERDKEALKENILNKQKEAYLGFEEKIATKFNTALSAAVDKSF